MLNRRFYGTPEKSHHEDIIKELENQIESLRRNAVVLEEEKRRLQHKNDTLTKQLMEASSQSLPKSPSSSHIIALTQDSPPGKLCTDSLPIITKLQEERGIQGSSTSLQQPQELRHVLLATQDCQTVVPRSRIRLSVLPTWNNKKVIFKNDSVCLRIPNTIIRVDGADRNLTISAGECMGADPTVWVCNNSNAEVVVPKHAHLLEAEVRMQQLSGVARRTPAKLGIDYNIGEQLELQNFGHSPDGALNDEGQVAGIEPSGEPNKEITSSSDLSDAVFEKNMEIAALQAEKDRLLLKVDTLEKAAGTQGSRTLDNIIDLKLEKAIFEAKVAEMEKDFAQALKAHEEELLLEQTIKLENLETAHKKALWEKDKEIAELLVQLQEYRNALSNPLSVKFEDDDPRIIIEAVENTDNRSSKKLKALENSAPEGISSSPKGYFNFIPHFFGFNANEKKRKRNCPSAIDPKDL